MERMSISEAFELYRLEYISFRNQSAKTEEMNAMACKSLIEFIGDDIQIYDVTFDLVRKWKDSLSKSGKKANTVRGYLIKLRVVLKHLRLKDMKVLNPDIIGIPKRENTVVEFLEVDEIQAMIKAVFAKLPGYSKFKRHRNRAIIALLFSSGVRNGELRSIDRSQIKPGVDSFTIIGKGNKPRLCFVDEVTMQYLQEYLALRKDNNPALFINELDKKRISAAMVQLIVKNAGKKAGISKDVHPHTMRHSFATDLLRNNTNLLYVRDFLGHASIQDTQVYTHVVNEDLRALHREKHTVLAAG